MSRETDTARDTSSPGCCPLYHEAVELIGRRWTGAIVATLMDADPRPMRFGEISQAVPELSDRMLSERLRELEARGVVERHVSSEPPVRVRYRLTPMGAGLEPALVALKAWAQHWLDEDAQRTASRAN
jgi:DNA-binding HxlR family transcriptional regulator